jgi:hypothetical protein
MISKNVLKIAENMISYDASRDKMYQAIDDMVNSRWSLPGDLPENLKSALHKVVTTDPHDAVRAAQRVLSHNKPRFKITPTGSDAESKAAADDLERGIAHLYHHASRRRVEGLTQDITWSAGKYAMVAGQVVYLPHEIEARRLFGGDTRRLEAARRYGPFSVTLHNPRSVHVRFSDWMPEAVLLKKVVTMKSAIEFWGSKAKKLQAHLRTNEGDKYVTVYDYTELNRRWVWAQPGTAQTCYPPGEDGVVIINGLDTGLDFMNWFVGVSGTSLEEDSGGQVVPMLKSIYDSGQWETRNLLETLLVSRIIALHYRPVLKEEGANPQTAAIDFDDPATPIAKAPPGNTLAPLSVEVIDRGLLEASDRMSGWMHKSTMPRLLLTGEFPSGTAMGTVNIITQSALQAIEPYRRLSERMIAEIGRLMMCWITQSGEALTLQPVEAEGRISIDPAHIDRNHFTIDAVLTPSVPGDMVARTNVSQMLIAQGYPKSRAWEGLNITDPQQAITDGWQEKTLDAVMEGELELIRAGYQARARQVIAGMAPPYTPTPHSSRLAALKSQGFNPARGGQSPLEAGIGG